jgi:hypothetical protein
MVTGAYIFYSTEIETGHFGDIKIAPARIGGWRQRGGYRVGGCAPCWRSARVQHDLQKSGAHPVSRPLGQTLAYTVLPVAWPKPNVYVTRGNKELEALTHDK